MSIQDTYEFDNRGEVVRHPALKRYFLAITIALLVILSFGLGKLSSMSSRPEVKIQYESLESGSSGANTTNPETLKASAVGTTQSSSAVYASSKGTKYYFENCRSTISEKNKITFASREEAERAGYTLASNCKP